MIDPLELKTRVLSSTGSLASGVLWTFTADDDLTLRSVKMNYGILSVSPTLTGPESGKTLDEFYLNAGLDATWKSWDILAFPLPKGTKLYWGNLGAVVDDAFVQLIVT